MTSAAATQPIRPATDSVCPVASPYRNPAANWSPAPVASIPVRGRSERAPVNRLFFVGRNYHAHAVEMGRPVDKSVERAFYFTQSPQTLVPSGTTVAYPTRSGKHDSHVSRHRVGRTRSDHTARSRRSFKNCSCIAVVPSRTRA